MGSQPLLFTHYSISSVCGFTCDPAIYNSVYSCKDFWSQLFVFMNDIVKLVEQGDGLHKYLNSHKIVRQKQIPKKTIPKKTKKHQCKKKTGLLG